MSKLGSGIYYISRKEDILDLFETHSRAWLPFLAHSYGDTLATTIDRAARETLQNLIPALPFIGGDENPLTRHILRSSTSLALYLTMKKLGKTAMETGWVIYQAVLESVRHLSPDQPPSPDELEKKKEQALRSRLRLFPGDWVWDFVEGDGVNFEYGYDFYECGVQKLYHAQGADEFLPFFCHLDFVTYRTPGWSFTRKMTLADGDWKCDFRFKKGGKTEKGWPPAVRKPG